MNASEKQVRQAAFWRKFRRLTRAGIPVLRALDIARQEERDAGLARSIGLLHQHVDGGDSLGDALTRLGDEFSLSTVELIKTAEKRGAWDEVLLELAEGLEEGTFE